MRGDCIACDALLSSKPSVNYGVAQFKAQICMAKLLALLTLDQGIVGVTSDGGEVLSDTKLHLPVIA